ncbi:ROK family protein [Treponema sp.]
MKQAHYYIGFDLGGTKMIAALVDEKGNILSRSRSRTPGEEGPDAVAAAMAKTVEAACAEAKIDPSEISALGAAIPGIIDPERGTVNLTNLNLKEYPLKSSLEKALKVPVILENDVNAGTWAEFALGAAKGYRHVIGVFVGTGIGGGLILDGKLYRGWRGSAGEIGHLIIQDGGPLCGCGQYGCLEAFAARTAMAKDAVAIAAAGHLPELINKTGTDFKKFKSSIFEKALDMGNESVQGIVDRAAYHLGVGLASAAMLLNPEVFVIGGGFADRLRGSYLETVTKTMHSKAMNGVIQDVKVILGTLGDDAVPLGAALLARDAYSEHE